MQPASHHLPGTMRAALGHPQQIWRALRRGDQSVLISTLLDLARSTAHPDAFFLDARPLGPKLLVVYSAEALEAMGDCAVLDKEPMANVAVAVSGDPNAYEGLLGPALGRPYAHQVELVEARIKAAMRGLRNLAQRRVREHLAPPCEFNMRRAQYFTASVILEQIFPARDWTPAAIREMIDALELNAAWTGPVVQNTAMRGLGPTAVLDMSGSREVVDRYERVFADLAAQERAAAAASTVEHEGLITQLTREGLSWSDTKAFLSTFFAGSYETVSSTLTEWVYQVSTSARTWRALQQSQGEERRSLLRASVYETVRLIAPVPILIRRAEQDCTLDIQAQDGSRRSLAIERGQLVLALNVAPLRDPVMFPEPMKMRLELDAAQRQRIRLAWGLESAPGSDTANRFCRGFSYSIALLTAAFETLLDEYAAPRLIHDCAVDMYFTQGRRGFVAQLTARAGSSTAP